MEFLKNLLASRAFWSGLGPLVVAVFNLIGHPLGDETVQAMTVVITFLAGFFGITVTRAAIGRPTSYRKAEQKAEKVAEDAKYNIWQ